MLSQSQSSEIQKSFRKFAKIERWSAPHAITLTMKQGVLAQGSRGDPVVCLTREAASQNYRHFLSLLSSRVLGKAAKRFGKRLNSVSVIERGGGKRLHIHAAIDCPRDDLVTMFPSIITEAWRRTQWGYSQIDIQPAADAGWINYISKLRDKPDYATAIDWENYHNADCRV